MKSNPELSSATANSLLYIRWAIRIGLIAGFTLGAHVAAVIGFGLPLGKTFFTYIQAHGHIQLMGWAGLFALGLASHVLSWRQKDFLLSARRETVLRILVFAILSRFVCDSVLPYLPGTNFFKPVNLLSAAAAGLLFFAVILLVKLVLQVKLENQNEMKAASPILLMLFGWLVYGATNFALLVMRVLNNAVILDQNWNELAVQTFVNLALIPLIFLPFGERNSSRAAAKKATRIPKIVSVFALAVALQLIPVLPPVAVLLGQLCARISFVGMGLKALVILAFVGQFGVRNKTTKYKSGRDFQSKLSEQSLNKNGLADFLRGAQLWLAFGAFLELAVAISALANQTLAISTDAIRHIYLLGFVTQFLFAVTPALFADFHADSWKTTLSKTTLLLVNLAVVCRVFPLILPPELLLEIPDGVSISQAIFGVSGVVALSALGCFAITFYRISRKLPTLIRD